MAYGEWKEIDFLKKSISREKEKTVRKGKHPNETLPEIKEFAMSEDAKNILEGPSYDYMWPLEGKTPSGVRDNSYETVKKQYRNIKFEYASTKEYFFAQSGFLKEALCGLDRTSAEMLSAFALARRITERHKNGEPVIVHDCLNPTMFPEEIVLIENKYWGIAENSSSLLVQNGKYLLLLKREEVLHLYITKVKN